MKCDDTLSRLDTIPDVTDRQTDGRTDRKNSYININQSINQSISRVRIAVPTSDENQNRDKFCK